MYLVSGRHGWTSGTVALSALADVRYLKIHSCAFKKVIIHQDEAKHLVRWVAKLLPCKSLQTQEPCWKISLARRERPPFAVHTIPQNASRVPAYPFFSWLHATAVIVDLFCACNLSNWSYKGLPPGINGNSVFGVKAAFSAETEVPVAFGATHMPQRNTILLLSGQAHKSYS